MKAAVIDLATREETIVDLTADEIAAREAWRPAPTADDVRAEAGRRITVRYPIHVQMNAQARAIELLLIGEANWTEAQATEAATLQAMRDWIKAVRAASNVMEPDPPADYRDPEHWPA